MKNIILISLLFLLFGITKNSVAQKKKTFGLVYSVSRPTLTIKEVNYPKQPYFSQQIRFFWLQYGDDNKKYRWRHGFSVSYTSLNGLIIEDNIDGLNFSYTPIFMASFRRYKPFVGTKISLGKSRLSPSKGGFVWSTGMRLGLQYYITKKASAIIGINDYFYLNSSFTNIFSVELGAAYDF